MEDRARSTSVGMQLIGIVAAAAITFTALGAWLSVHDFRRAHRAASAEAQERAKLAADSITSTFDEARNLVASTVTEPSLPEVLKADPDQCSLAGAGSGIFRRGHLDLFRPDGMLVCSSVTDTGAPDRARLGAPNLLARLVRANEPIVSGVFTDRLAADVPAIAVAAPIRANGRLIGGFAAVLHLRDGASELARLHGSAGWSFTILDRSSGTIVSSSLAPATIGTQASPDPELLANRASLDALDWDVVAGVDRSTAFGTAWSAVRRNALLGTVALGVVIVLGFALWRRLAMPLSEVTRAIRQSTRKVTPAPLPAGGPTEVRELAASFNELVGTRARYEDALLRQSFLDELTGLPNRALLVDRARTAIERGKRAPGSVALLFVDIDHFKKINESHGHAAGDLILKEIALRLSDVLRAGDTVARMAADEFVILCQGLQGVPQADAIAERVQLCLLTPFQVDGNEAVLSASIGIAMAEGGDDPDSMLRDADVAMSMAKRKGPGSHEFYDRSLRDAAKERMRIERDLRAAIDKGELRVHYQPVADLRTGRITSVEALLRWDHPTRGRIAPMTFIPIAEETGQIHEIGRWVLHQACGQAARWHAMGHDFKVSVNVSARQLAHPSLPAIIQSALSDSGLQPDRLVIEITESTLMDETASVRDLLTGLKMIGIAISVDDFGTGYSSLAYLQRFPVDQLKIDRAFVEELRPGTGRSAIVGAITDMARALALDVVAEGIESPSQIEALLDLGCRRGQGFLLARPMPPDEAEMLLRIGVETGVMLS